MLSLSFSSSLPLLPFPPNGDAADAPRPSTIATGTARGTRRVRRSSLTSTVKWG